MRDLKTFLSAAPWSPRSSCRPLPAAAQTGRIGGTVKDQQGQPLKGATITAENPNASPSSFTATTDDKGRYSIIGLRPGRGRSRPSAPGFQPSSGSVPVRTIGAPMPPVDFVLAPGAAGPTGALAGVNTKELQGELQKADRHRQRRPARRGDRRLQRDPHQDAGADDDQRPDRRVQRLKKDYDGAIASYQKVLAADPNNDARRSTSA